MLNFLSDSTGTMFSFKTVAIAIAVAFAAGVLKGCGA